MKTLSVIAACLVAIGSLGAQESKQDPVMKGEQAPALETRAVDGRPVNWGNLEGKKVLLSFLRYAGCPVCHYRVHELQNEYQALKNEGWEVVVVFETAPETLAEYQREYNFPFVMVADPDNALYERYAVERSTGKFLKTMGQKEANAHFKEGKKMIGTKIKRDGKMNRIGADFVIGPDRQVIESHYGSHVGDHIPVAALHAL